MNIDKMTEKYRENIPCTLYHGITGMFHDITDNIELLVLGCESSIYDGKRIVELLLENGCKEDVLVMNTCAVTEDDRIISREMFRMLRAIYPHRKIIAAGCAVKYGIDDYEGAFLRLDNFEKRMASSYSQLFGEAVMSHKVPFDVHNKASLISIQDGCSSNCSYCIIPKLRGGSVSKPWSDVQRQIQNSIGMGMTKIRITGSEICRYKSDGMDLVGLCNRIVSEFPQITKVEFNALDPASGQCDGIIQLARECQQFNDRLEFSTQSLDDTVLKMMNRRHNVDRMMELGRQMDGKVEFSIHIIVGFPGETAEMFENTCRNVRKLKPWLISVHPYSDRQGTLASVMPNKVSQCEIERRCQKLNRIFEEYRLPDTISTKTWNHRTKKYKLDITFSNFYRYYPLGEHIQTISSLETPEDAVTMMGMIRSGRNFMIRHENIRNYMKFECFSRYMIWRYDVKMIVDIDINERNVDEYSGNRDFMMRIQQMGCFMHFTISDIDEMQFGRFSRNLISTNEFLFNVFMESLDTNQRKRYGGVISLLYDN